MADILILQRNTKDKQSTHSSYGRILTSTAIVGGSQALNIGIGIVRTKFMAVLLGPSGVGLMGMYQAVIGLVGSVTGLGIGSSGVRQIAEAAGTGDEQKIAATTVTLRRAAFVLGLLGAVVTFALSGFLSKITFGTTTHGTALALLSITLFLTAVSNGQTAIIQGMQRIYDLAQLTVWTAFLSTAISIPPIYWWREGGIVAALIAISASTVFTSWWFARKVPLVPLAVSWKDTVAEARSLLGLGFAFMASGVMVSAVMFLIRSLLVRRIGLEGVGLYQASYTLSGLYIAVILDAMGKDFYPRLTTVAMDNDACNRMVNEQTEVGLLIAVPGIVATLLLAPLIIETFYSSRFVPAYEILRWQILGVFLRVISWPLGFVQLAKGKGALFFATEAASNLAHLGLIWLGVSLYGLPGTGMAFFALYLFYTLMILAVSHRLTGFRWSLVNVKLGIGASLWIALTFSLPYFFSRQVAFALGGALTLAAAVYCLRRLVTLVGSEWFLVFFSKFKARVGKEPR